MAVNPKHISHVYAVGTKAAKIHTLELYLDFVCPFSAKLWERIITDVIPYVEKEKPGQVEFVFRQLVQPWHPSSTLGMQYPALEICKRTPAEDSLQSTKLVWQSNESTHPSFGHSVQLSLNTRSNTST